MTLFKQLAAGISVLFLVLLAGVEAIYLANSRTQLQEQLAAQAQETATSLSLRLSTLGNLDDRSMIEALVNPVFDRGYFQEVLVLSFDGRLVVRKAVAANPGGVPAWFVWLFPIHAPAEQSLVSSGWVELGRVVVVSQPYFAYRQLWSSGLQTIVWLMLGYAAALAAAMAFLAMLLRPLREIERAAVAIGERDFVSISVMPRSRELARVVAAFNEMSGSLRTVIAEEAAKAEKFRREAYIDPLTALYNRRGFEHQLRALIQSAGDVYAGALALLEIRNFGAFNAKVGFRRGDEVIGMLAAALVAACDGHAAVCGRLGGANFAVAVVNIDAGRLRELVVAVCARIRQVLVDNALESDLHFHCGATQCEGTLAELSEMLSAADHAVEKARGRGENEYEIAEFSPSASTGSQAWREVIQRCIDADGISLFSQDVLRLSDGKPVHSEITARLLLGADAPVTAAQFLPMAVRHGLVGRVDCRVVEKVLDYLSHGEKPAVVALNVAASTIADAQATRHLLALLDARLALASRLVFEMTEFGAMQDLVATRRFSVEVKRRGAQFALDTFGMRQDTLKLIHAVRPQYIKLSAGYSREIADNPDCRFLVTSLVRVAQRLGIGIYAQAVEDAGLIPLLGELGLAGYQGYAGSRPVQIA